MELLLIDNEVISQVFSNQYMYNEINPKKKNNLFVQKNENISAPKKY